MMDKSKGIGKVYLEKKILGEELLELRETVKKMKKLYKNNEDFNFKDNAAVSYTHLTLPTNREV